MKKEKLKVRLPDAIEKEMKKWRNGLILLPKAYVDFHKERALEALEEIRKLNVYRVIGESEMIDDGWLDGMKFVSVVLEDRKGGLFRIKWSDSQYWYERCESGGWVLRADLPDGWEADDGE